MARMRETTRLHLAAVEAHLARFPYFAGQAFTAADVMTVFPFTTRLRFRALDLGTLPGVVRRVRRRSGYASGPETACSMAHASGPNLACQSL